MCAAVPMKVSASHQVITGSGLEPAASHSTTYSLLAERGSPRLVMLTSIGGKIMSRVMLFVTGVEMLLLLDWQVRVTPGHGLLDRLFLSLSFCEIIKMKLANDVRNSTFL